MWFGLLMEGLGEQAAKKEAMDQALAQEMAKRQSEFMKMLMQHELRMSEIKTKDALSRDRLAQVLQFRREQQEDEQAFRREMQDFDWKNRRELAQYNQGQANKRLETSLAAKKALQGGGGTGGRQERLPQTVEQIIRAVNDEIDTLSKSISGMVNNGVFTDEDKNRLRAMQIRMEELARARARILKSAHSGNYDEVLSLFDSLYGGGEEMPNQDAMSDPAAASRSASDKDRGEKPPASSLMEFMFQKWR